MSKKTNDETIDFIYPKSTNMKKSNNKGKSKGKNKNVPKKTKEDVINLDNEIIIGLTPKKEQKEKTKKQASTKKNNSKKKTSNNKKPSKTVNNKKQTKPKKQVDEKKKIRKIKIVKWTSISLIAIGAIILFMLSPIFSVKQIKVERTQKLSSEQIINLSQIKLNQNTFKVRGVDVIKRIESSTYVEKVYIKRELPSTIKITIKERTPRYVIEIGNGIVYIDSKGYILEISDETIPMPTITGYSTNIDNIVNFEDTKRLCEEDCKKLETINQIIEAAENNDVLTYITSIDISDINNIDITLETENKIAHLGDGSNAINRISYLKKIIETEAGKEGEIFINGDLSTRNPKPKPYFREKV